ncbi:hypothetical protein B0H16DRAFT_1736948 [Mycena metata]|uniref:Anaphase-promoting complex subunit 4 WD40 domain-containing protein n=1 Tax=Mycena metata TaxID=1033252 RepID=A0AAD7HN29_9AGAR|nr:hypothetical protein B0H16DRAFT_1736948 [Mycena metata]
MGTATAMGEDGEWERSRDAEVDFVRPLASAVGAAGAGRTCFARALTRGLARTSPAASKPSTPSSPAPGHATLPYHMLYAVVTMDAVAIYDRQSGPVCLLTKLHCAEFTDLAWSPNGQCLILGSRDGYCTLVTVDEILPTHHTQPRPSIRCRFCSRRARIAIQATVGAKQEVSARAADAVGECRWGPGEGRYFHRHLSPLDVRESPQLFASIKKHPPLLFCEIKVK